MSTPNTTHPALYRVYQFFVALKASLPAWAGGVNGGLTPADYDLMAAILPGAAQQELFKRMPPNDRRHALAVARTLQQAGHNEPGLMQAALLHDVGKSIGQPLMHRVVIVLLEAFWPAGLARVSASGEAGWWRRPFVIHARHAAIGAAWASEAECLPLAVSLIAKHQDKLDPDSPELEEKLLATLQWADNLN